MTMEFSLKLPGTPAAQNNLCASPPSWPPPLDWIVSLHRNGTPLSEWGAPMWDFTAWAGYSFQLYFAKTPRKRNSKLSPQNQYLLRMCATWLIWGPQGKISWKTLRTRFNLVRRVVLLCEQNGIVASDLVRFPRVQRLIIDAVTCKEDRKVLLVVFDRLYRGREPLGFVLLDEAGIRRLAEEFSASDYDDIEQTAYIPSRIWTYQVTRLRECLDDFLAHRQEVEDCFNFCLAAYVKNYGSLAAAVTTKRNAPGVNPFANPGHKTGKRTGREYHGRFEDTAKRFGVNLLFRKWAETPGGALHITQFSTYLSLVQYAGLAYIGNFTLQRSAEFSGLRSDCLLWEEDASFGRIPTICGETTKTAPDSDARWPTSPSVEVAVEALTAVAGMRIRCGLELPDAGCTEYDARNPFLYGHAYEPWSTKGAKPYSVRPSLACYADVVRRFPRLFDLEKLRITQEDLDTARLFTPNLDKAGSFVVGKIWPLTYHQLRRTGAVNMFASGILSDSSIQVIMKHLTVLQTRYYGKNFSRLRFNQEWEDLTVSARYEVMAKQIEAITEERYVSPYGEERKRQIVLDLIGEKDCEQLAKEGIKGNVSFRAIRLGGCTNREHCEYGGIESISRCTGSDGGKPCPQVIYDKKKRPSAERQLEGIKKKLNNAEADSPRAQALHAEAQGLRNFLNDTRE